MYPPFLGSLLIYFSDITHNASRPAAIQFLNRGIVAMPLRPITEELLRRLRETLDRLESLSWADPSDRDLSALKSIIETRIKEIEDRNENQAA